MGKCTGCGKFFLNLTTHSNHCEDLRIRSDRALKIHRKVQADPVLRRQRDEGLGIGQGSSFRKSRLYVPNVLKRQRDEVPVGPNGNTGDVDAASGTDPPEPIAEPSPSPAQNAEPAELPPKRKRRLTEKLRAMLGDTIPEGPGAIFEYVNADSDSEQVDDETPESLFIRIRRRFKSVFNTFSLQRTYRGLPTNIPDRDVEFTYLLSDNLHSQAVPLPNMQSRLIPRTVTQIIAPYPNISTCLLNSWFWRTGKKTKHERDALLEVMADERFRPEDVRGVDFNRLDQMVVEYANHQDHTGPSRHQDLEEEAVKGWKKTAVRINIPTGQKETKATKKKKAARRRLHEEEDGEDSSADENMAAIRYHVPDFHHRSLVDVITEACSGESSSRFHWHPYEENWQPPWENAEAERVHGELYTSTAFLDADRLLHESPREPGCDLPRVIVALIFSSDATHLTQFGEAKLHPIYVFFGNQSKYERGVQVGEAAYTLAFIPGLPAGLVDFFRKSTGRHPTAALISHCRRELYHACWEKVFDEAFLAAYEHGMPMECGDQIRRRTYPRIFIKSMDYPEKITAISIRDMGLVPCPRCTILKVDFFRTGEASDMEARLHLVRKNDDEYQKKMADAHKLIYKKGYVVNSGRVEALLKDESLVPTQSAFSHPRLRACGLDMFDLMAVDLMHEVELGVWKRLLEHLLRMLDCQGSAAENEFNLRFRQVAPFGKSTIRKFTYNVTDLRKLAARDYEDILQCCIPCIEGLLPQEANETILDLLYLMAYFHSLAKLRMHTDSSIAVLRQVTTNLCDAFRYFANGTCMHFDTHETDREYEARRRKGKGGQEDGKRRQAFSLATSKFHALPDYPDQIIRFGTTDSYSTKPGESKHHILKEFYARTNKNNFVPQIAKINDLSCFHRHISNELDAYYAEQVSAHKAAQDDQGITPITKEALSLPYQIASTNKRSPVFLPTWLEEHEHDLAFKDFLPRLKAFILAQHRQLPFTSNALEFTDEELSDVFIEHNVIYEHATASFNFTTYDVRREQEGINTNRRFQGNRTRCDVMLSAPESASCPFLYARVLGIFHLEAYLNLGKTRQHVDFLWVRWFESDMAHSSGPSTLRLEQVKFLPMESPKAFGFLHTSSIIRPCHTIPVFSCDKRKDLSAPSWAQEEHGDWKKYYIMRFVDRDMMMRYLGLGVGHRNPPEFPREDHSLRQIPSGPYYTELQDAILNIPKPSNNEQGKDGIDEVDEEVDEVEEWLRTQVVSEPQAVRGDFYDL